MAAKSTNQPDLRDVVHLGGALPPEVVLEVVYLPTFHEALGIRMTTGHLEWWQRDRVESVSSKVGGAMLIRAERALAFPSNDDREWRDGITILVRTQQVELERSNPTANDPVRVLALEVLAVAGQHVPDPEALRTLAELNRYFH